MPSAIAEPKKFAGRDELAARLQRLIEELHEWYEKMDRLADARKQAVSIVDVRALGEHVQAENEIVQRVAQLDTERASIVRDAAHLQRLDPNSTTMSELAAALDSPRSEELLNATRRLRALMERVQRKNAATRQAAQTLARHMQGLLLEAEQRHSHSGAYGRGGTVRAGARVVTALDFTT